MTDKEIVNADGSRNWEANILFDNLKRLEQENAELKAENERLKQEWRLDCLKCEYKNTKADVDKYKQTLQEIKNIAEETVKTTGMISAGFIIQKITETEEE